MLIMKRMRRREIAAAVAEVKRQNNIRTFQLMDHYHEIGSINDEAMHRLYGMRLEAEADVAALEEILGCIWLYIKWNYVTKQLTTEQKERFADAVDAWSLRLNDGDSDPVADRWWRE